MSSSDTYFPPPESQGGWRACGSDSEVRTLAGMDPGQLDLVAQQQTFLHGGDSWGFAIIRHGWLARECYTFNVLVPTRFDIWSGTKSFTGTAWGLLLEESRSGRLPQNRQVEDPVSPPTGEGVPFGMELDSPIYPFIPEGYPLSDPRKERITVRHLLSMTSGIRGERYGLSGIATRTGDGPFELAFGVARTVTGSGATY